MTTNISNLNITLELVLSHGLGHYKHFIQMEILMFTLPLTHFTVYIIYYNVLRSNFSFIDVVWNVV